MPQPWTYRHASREYRAFLDDAKERMGLTSDNMTYTAVDGVFQTFRRRLTAQEGLNFASVLPSIPRAIFIANWILAEPLPFAPRTELVAEVKALRPNHNLTPDNAIEATAYALRRRILTRDFERALTQMPEGSVEFWHVDVDDPRELEMQIV